MTVALSLAMTYGPARSAHAQNPRVRVTHLRFVANFPDNNIAADGFGTAGINNKGQVVYTYEVSSGLYRAWVWMPGADYGFSAQFAPRVLDSSSNTSVARDINENGRIAGFSGGQFGNRQATVWTLANNTVTPTTIGGSTPSDAYALNNESSARIVGWRTVSSQNCEGDTVRRAFSWVFGGTVTNLIPDPFGSYDDEASNAVDIRRNGNQIVVGTSETCGQLGVCSAIFEGTAWDNASPPNPNFVDFGDIQIGAARDSHPYGVNDAGNVVGWVWYDEAGVPVACAPTGAFWDDKDDDDPLDLAQFLANPAHFSQGLCDQLGQRHRFSDRWEKCLN